MSELKTELMNAVKTAMKAGDKERVSTIRFVQAAIKQKEIDGGKALEDVEVVQILQKQIKQLAESVAVLEGAGRAEAAQADARQMAILNEFLPKQASEEELKAAIDAVLAKAGEMAAGAKMGFVMKEMKAQFAGKADMGLVNRLVKEKVSA